MPRERIEVGVPAPGTPFMNGTRQPGAPPNGRVQETAEEPGGDETRRSCSEELIRSAVHQLAQMTGRKVEAVVGLGCDERGWHVEAEVLEVRQVPELADILATYEVDVDGTGRLRSYRRRRRYARGQVDSS